jgi:hypothetical protein
MGSRFWFTALLLQTACTVTIAADSGQGHDRRQTDGPTRYGPTPAAGEPDDDETSPSRYLRLPPARPPSPEPPEDPTKEPTAETPERPDPPPHSTETTEQPERPTEPESGHPVPQPDSQRPDTSQKRPSRKPAPPLRPPETAIPEQKDPATQPEASSPSVRLPAPDEAPPTTPPPQEESLPPDLTRDAEVVNPRASSLDAYRPGGGSLTYRSLPRPPRILQSTSESDGYEPAQILVIHGGMEEALRFEEALTSRGHTIKQRRMLRNLGLVLSVVRLQEGVSPIETVETLQAEFTDLWVDLNHRYQPQASTEDRKRYGQRMTGFVLDPGCGMGISIGLIDSEVDANHPALLGRVVKRSMLSGGTSPAASDHGTAIAALLVGDPVMPEFAGLMPGARLYAAGVLRKRDRKHEDATSESLIYALDWLLEENARAVNISLGGSRNRVLELALMRAIEKDVFIIAAAGNGGAGTLPLYPAAQAEVIAATAIDANSKPYRHAAQGQHIDFAAPGVDIWVARTGGGVYRSGTSYAAPFVLAALLSYPGAGLQALEGLKAAAQDLGKPGHDSQFGFGLVRASDSCR